MSLSRQHSSWRHLSLDKKYKPLSAARCGLYVRHPMQSTGRCSSGVDLGSLLQLNGQQAEDTGSKQSRHIHSRLQGSSSGGTDASLSRQVDDVGALQQKRVVPSTATQLQPCGQDNPLLPIGCDNPEQLTRNRVASVLHCASSVNKGIWVGNHTGPGPGDQDVIPQGPPASVPVSNSVSSGSHGSSTGGGRQPLDSESNHVQLEPDYVRGLVYGATVRFSDSAALRLRRRAMVVWEEQGPKHVLLVKKPTPAAAAMLLKMAQWLERHGLQIYVEQPVHKFEFPQFSPFDPHSTEVDFAITLGGDGTVLHLASLFEEDAPLPPVMCFAMGTLGFLTPFDAASYRSCLERVLAANRQPLFCTLRTRKRCVVLDSEGRQLCVHHILNECVIDRGAFPSSVHLEIYIDGTFVTAAEADGIIVATPSGSTAYSMSAGGSMVAPSVPCTLLTPLCPHSLSFRPLIIPENAGLLIRLPPHARSHARASFDGKRPMRIARGGSVQFTTSLCPLPLINIGTLDTDWYEGITHKLQVTSSPVDLVNCQ